MTKKQIRLNLVLSLLLMILTPFTANAQRVWRLVTDASTLKDGDRVVIAMKNYNLALSKNRAANGNVGASKMTKYADGTANFKEGTAVMKLNRSNGRWRFKSEGKILYASLGVDSKNLKLDDSEGGVTADLCNIDIADGVCDIVFAPNYKSNYWVRGYIGASENYFMVYSSQDGAEPLQLYRAENAEGYDVTIGSVGYATMFFSNHNVKVPKGIEASTCYFKDGQLTQSHVYKPGSTIPPSTGVVLKGNPGTYSFYQSPDEGAIDNASMLRGSDEPTTTTGGNIYFKLAVYKGEVGFYWGAYDGAAFALQGHNHAYLAVPESEAEKIGSAKGFPFSSAVTGISSVSIQKDLRNLSSSGAAYNLQGQRVDSSFRGIVIVGGKKILRR